MTINDAMRKYRLPNPTTPEDLECRWSKLLTFGDKVVIAGYYYNGQNKPCYFGATYEFLDDDHTCEGAIGLRAASDRQGGAKKAPPCLEKGSQSAPPYTPAISRGTAKYTTHSTLYSSKNTRYTPSAHIVLSIFQKTQHMPLRKTPSAGAFCV